MSGMTHEDFDNALMDELYGELDAATSDAMALHAASCPDCAQKLSKLRATRAAVSSLVVPFPNGLEDRVMAAAQAAEQAMMGNAPTLLAVSPPSPSALGAPGHYGSAAPPPPAGAPPKKEESGAKIFAFLSRPQLAAAAVVVLVLGATALFGMSTMSKRGAPESAAANDDSKASSASNAPAPAQESSPTALATVAASAAPPPPAAAPVLAEGHASGPAAAPAPLAAKAKAGRADGDSANCEASLPKLEAIARKNAGTEEGSRAQLEAARCYQRIGQTQQARSRYNKLAKDDHVADEALAGLEQLDEAKTPAAAAPAATSTAGTRSGGKAAPKAAKPPAAKPAALE